VYADPAYHDARGTVFRGSGAAIRRCERGFRTDRVVGADSVTG